MTDENETPPETPPTPPTEETPTENQMEKAERLNSEMKDNLDRREELIVREEKLEASRILGGKSQAGQVPVPPPEETPEEYAKKAMSGDLNED